MSDVGILLPAPVFIAVDAEGEPISGALLQFYLSETTTPTPAYADAGLTTPLSNPVVANSAGLFPPIYLDPTVLYRLQLQQPSTSVIADVDPVNIDVTAATQTQVNLGVATDVYVSPATLAGWTGVAAALGYTPLNKAGDTATDLALNPAGTPAAYSAGYLGSPINPQNAGYTLVLSDAGKTILSTSSSADTWTIPLNAAVAFPVGTIIGLINTGSASVTVAPTSGASLNLAGAGTSGNRTLAQWGVATLTLIGADTWIIGGAGLS